MTDNNHPDSDKAESNESVFDLVSKLAKESQGNINFIVSGNVSGNITIGDGNNVGGGLNNAPSQISVPFDASNYIETVINQYENYDKYLQHSERKKDPIIFDRLLVRDLQNTFVPLRARNKRGLSIPSLDSYIDKWLTENDRDHLVLLGNYGSGKTAFCFHLVHRLLLRYRDDPISNILPIYVTFRQLLQGENDAPLDEILIGLLTNKPPKNTSRAYLIKGLTLDNVYEVFNKHDILLILDGFDEIVSTVSIDEITKRFLELKNILEFSKKVMITCRENYLPSDESFDIIFPEQSTTSRLGFAYPFQFEVIRLSHFDEAQQKEYLECLIKDKEQRNLVFQAIERTHDLSELAQRPVLLFMVIKYFERHVANNKLFTATLIYNTVITDWLTENFIMRHTDIEVEKGMDVFEALAIKLINEKVEVIDRDSLSKFLRKNFGDNPLGKSIKQTLYAFETCAFLMVIGERGDYGFIHRSFLEFFLARALLQEIEQGKYDQLGQTRLFNEVVVFLAGLINEQAHQSREVIKQQLITWMIQSSNKEAPKYLGGNSAAILCHMGFRFKGLNLSGVNFKHADLSRGNFSECDLSNANMDGSILTKSNFSSSNLQNVKLDNTFIKETLFQNANLQNASFLNVRMIGGPTNIWNAVFSPDGLFIVIGTSKGEIIILPYSGDDYTVFDRMNVSESDILHFCFSADGKYLAACDRSRIIYIYSWSKIILREKQQPRKLSGNDDYVRWLHFAPDQPILLSGARDHSVKLWYLEKEPIDVKSFRHHTEPVMCVAWQPDTHYVASGGYDRNVYLSPADQDHTEHIHYQLVAEGETHTHNHTVRAMAFNSTGKMIATAGEGDAIKLWDVSDPAFPKFLHKIATSLAIFNLVFVDNNKILIAGSADGMILKYDLSNNQLIQEIRAHQDYIRSFSINNKENLLLTSSWDGSVKLWHLNDLSLHSIIFDSIVVDDNAAKSYGINGAFENANISGLHGINIRFRDFFIALGAKKE